MLIRHLSIWISIIGGALITMFADNTHYYVSYLLRIPGYIFAQYISVYVTIRIGGETFYLSVVRVMIYSLIIYIFINLISSWRKWKHQTGCYGEQVLLGMK
jgi:hypothetical protein